MGKFTVYKVGYPKESVQWSVRMRGSTVFNLLNVFGFKYIHFTYQDLYIGNTILLFVVPQRKLVNLPRTVLPGLRPQPTRPHLQVHASSEPQRHLEL